MTMIQIYMNDGLVHYRAIIMIAVALFLLNVIQVRFTLDLLSLRHGFLELTLFECVIKRVLVALFVITSDSHKHLHVQTFNQRFIVKSYIIEQKPI